MISVVVLWCFYHGVLVLGWFVMFRKEWFATHPSGTRIANTYLRRVTILFLTLDLFMENNHLKDFLIDSNVKHAMDWGKERNVFSILGMGENRHSNMLAWLLNPREGHLLGDYFLQELIRASYNEDTEQYYKIFDFSLDAYNFNNAILFREFNVGNGKKIDIAILDPENEIAIFIENKYGSCESDEQTSTYHEELTAKYGDQYTCIFIFMDWNESEAKCDEFINLGYDWLASAIEKLLDRDILSTNIEVILVDYLARIKEDDTESAYYSQVYEEIIKIASQYKCLLADIKKKISLDTNPEDLMSCFADGINNPDYIKYLYKREKAFFDALFEISDLQVFSDKLEQELSPAKLDIEFGKEGYFDFARKEWYILDKKSADYCFTFVSVKEEKLDDGTELYKVRSWLRPKNLKNRYFDKFEALKLDLIRNSPKNKIAFEKVVPKELIVETAKEAYRVIDNIYKSLTA
jgi:hypothetical protein